MATLELGIDEAVAPAPARRAPARAAVLDGDRLDDLRVCGGDLRRLYCRCRARPTWTCWRSARRSRRQHWLGTDGLGRDELARADLWRADIADRRPVCAHHRPYARRRARHAGGLFPRPVRIAGGRQHGCAAGVSAAGPGAGRDRLSRAIGPQSHLHPRRARHSRLHAGGAGGDADAGAARIRHRGAGARAPPMRASCCASCCPT